MRSLTDRPSPLGPTLFYIDTHSPVYLDDTLYTPLPYIYKGQPYSLSFTWQEVALSISFRRGRTLLCGHDRGHNTIYDCTAALHCHSLRGLAI